MDPLNLVIVMSDQHSAAMTGCYGHPFVKTPSIDMLAASGTRFAACYTPSPVCIPARAAFATGKYIHQIGYWDNADPYDGAIPSWHHILRDAGHEVVAVGKLHFQSDEKDYGFTDTIVPMHVVEGKGDLLGLIRDELPVRGAAYKMAQMAGPGESIYTQYDREIAARAQIWLHEKAGQPSEKPWVLFVSFVSPHYPLTAPPEHYYRYFNDPDLPMPLLYGNDERPTHPFVLDYARSFNFDDYFETENDVRRATAGYFGLCSFMDEQLGKVQNALRATGLDETTRVLYTSDHGDALGKRGLWGKSTLFEETVKVPLIVAGADLPAGRTVTQPASLLDIFPFILRAVGHSGPEKDEERPGISLDDLIAGAGAGRTVLSEYHGMGSTTGAYAIRYGRFKYIHYVDYAAQLFDLEADPHETRDLAGDLEHAETIAKCFEALTKLLDPVEVDRRAKARQAEQLEKYGGAEAIIARGDLGFSPPPGIQAEFN